MHTTHHIVSAVWALSGVVLSAVTFLVGAISAGVLFAVLVGLASFTLTYEANAHPDRWHGDDKCKGDDGR